MVVFFWLVPRRFDRPTSEFRAAHRINLTGAPRQIFCLNRGKTNVLETALGRPTHDLGFSSSAAADLTQRRASSVIRSWLQ